MTLNAEKRIIIDYQITTSETIWSCSKHTNETFKGENHGLKTMENHGWPARRPPMRWSDHIRKDTGLPLETDERQTIDKSRKREKARGNCA